MRRWRSAPTCCAWGSRRSTRPSATSAATRARSPSQIARARDEGAALVVFPELSLTGYPPEDLLLKTGFLDAARAALRELAAEAKDIVAVVGFPEQAEDVYNAAAVLADGDIVAVYRKMYLPNYGVFDEQRYFQSGSEARDRRGERRPVGITICEDIWEPGPPAMTRGARRRAGDRQPLRLAVPRRLRRRGASGCSCSGRSTTSPRWSS